MGKNVDVKIAGRDYTLSTVESEEYMQRLADYVSARILGFKRQNGASPLDAATMAAMAIADELFREKRDRESEKGR